jgi:hypothetical protein
MVDFNVRVIVDPARAVSGAQQVERALDGVENSATQLNRAIDQGVTSNTRSTQATTQNATATQRLAREQAQAAAAASRARAAEAALTTTRQAQLRVSAQSAQVEAQRVTALGALGGTLSSLRPQIQNASFQLQDIAVQLQGGSNASLVLAQQLPQLAGGFGAVGAVIGVLIGLGIPLINQFVDLNALFGSTDSLLQDLIDTTREYQDALEGVFSSNQELGTQFGEQAQRARDLFRVQQDILRLQAERQQETLFQSLTNDLTNADTEFARRIPELVQRLRDLQVEAAGIGNAGEQFTRVTTEIALTRNQLGNLPREVRRVSNEFGITTGAAVELLGRIQDVREAANFSEQAESFRRLSTFITDNILPLNRNNQELQELVLSILAAEQNAIRLREAGNAITFEAATQSASGLTRELSNALSVLQEIQNRQAVGNITGAGLRAQQAALERGLSPIQAQTEGRIAERRAELAPALGAGDAIIRRAAQDALQQETQDLRDNAAIRQDINDRVREFNRLNRRRRGGGGGGRERTPGTRGTEGTLTLQVTQLEQQLEAVFDEYEAQISQTEVQEQRRLDIINRAREVDVISAQRHAELRTQIAAAQAREEERIQRAAISTQLTSSSEAFSALAQVTRDGLGEQSGAYRAFFAASKAFAIADAILKINQAVANAFSVAFPFNIPLIGQAVAQGARIVNIIRATEPSGFQEGGFTGNIGVNQVAGVVHGQEFVMNAAATRQIGLPALEAMQRTGNIPVQPIAAPEIRRSQNIMVRVENLGTPQEYEVAGVSDGEVRLIARDIARDEVARSVPGLVANEVRNPNSPVSREIGRSTNATRRR